MEIVHLEAFSLEQVCSKSADVLRRGGLIIYPTDTVYGVAVDATNEDAVKNLLQYKGKQFTQPIPIAVDSLIMAEKYVDVNGPARNLYQHFLPGPLTIVSKSKGVLPKLLESPNGTLGVRIIDHPFVQSLIVELGRPITTTSASPNVTRPYSLQILMEQLSQVRKEMVDLAVDAGTLPRRETSTVVDTTYEQQVLLRGGSLQLALDESVGTVTPEETIAYGQKLIERYMSYIGFKPVVFALSGDMGAGKTHLTKGIALGLGIDDDIQSPTFILQRDHVIPTGGMFYHLDLWRIQDEEELTVLDLDQLMTKNNVFVIEWAERIESWFNKIKDDAIILWVDFRYGETDFTRNITVRIHI